MSFIENDEGPDSFNLKLLNHQPSNKVRITVKNYNSPVGVATSLHRKGETYEVKGPMGKGLEVKQAGVHVAFSAGTGVLVFVDLVA